MDCDDCCGCSSSTLVNNHQYSQHGESLGSSSSTLVELLLCLPALRQADQLIRQYWTRVHRENQHVTTTINQQQPQIMINSGVGFNRQSIVVDRSTSICTTNNVKMNKLFVEMLEACLR